MSTEVKVVVAGKIYVIPAVDPGGCAGGSFVHLEERIADAEAFGTVIHNPELLIPGMQIETVKLFRNGLTLLIH